MQALKIRSFSTIVMSDIRTKQITTDKILLIFINSHSFWSYFYIEACDYAALFDVYP